MPNFEALVGHLLVGTVENLEKGNGQDESWTSHFLNAREVYVFIYLFIHSFIRLLIYGCCNYGTETSRCDVIQFETLNPELEEAWRRAS